MKLKNLYINGFKSFASKTNLEFDKKIIALVGPNGCGKSNIVDAIFWMFQRSGLKNLRAKEKQDLIFKGNNNRRQSGFAEVAIDFADSSEDSLEKKEAKVRKRLFQSGETQYFLNNEEVKHKDVEKFYMNNDISSPEYSIIAQGKVEKIISSKTEDKRVIIEEAAGIRKYKNDRNVAVRKLTKAKDNLDQLNILLEEISVEAEKLSAQAEKANEYRELKKKLVDNEKYLYISKYEKVQTSLQKLVKDNKEYEIQAQVLEEKIKSLDNVSSEDKKKMEHLNKEITEIRETIIKLDGEISTYEKTVAFHRQRFEELRNSINSKESNIKNLENRYEQIIELLSLSTDEDEQSLEAYKEREEEYNDKLESIAEEQNKKEIEKRELKQKVKQQEEELKKLMNDEKQNIEQQFVVLNDLLDKLSNIVDSKKKSFESIFSIKSKIEISLKSKKEIVSDFLKFSQNNSHKYIENLATEIDKVDNLFTDIFAEINNIHLNSSEIEKIFFSEDSVFMKREMLISKMDELSDNIEKNKREISFLEEDLQKSLQTKDIITKEKMQILQNISQLEEKIKNNLRQKDRLEQEKIEYEYQIKNAKEDLIISNQKLEESKQSGTKNFDLIEETKRKKSELDKEIKEKESQIDKLSQKLIDLQTEYNDLFAKKRELGENRNSYISKSSKYESQMETIKSMFFDTYREDIDDVEYTDDINSESTIRKNINQFQARIEEIGEVNLLALDEFNEVKKRKDFLTEQKEDVLSSIEDLQKVIRKLEEQLNQTFIEAFEEIQKNFKNIFISIFGGGDAQIYLTDPENILETGVDIKIQPPGKKITHLGLLSGGEKTMSAVALLFALFLYKPSPFCIMDELDAPLDERNVLRYRKLLMDFSNQTQFIIISHNKITLECADILYGITMQEDGVSKVVSAKLEGVFNEE